MNPVDSKYSNRLFLISGMLLLMLQYLSACSATPPLKKNVGGPEISVLDINEKETFVKPVFDRFTNSEGIYSIAISQDGRYMAIGRTNLVELWDTLRGGKRKSLKLTG